MRGALSSLEADAIQLSAWTSIHQEGPWTVLYQLFPLSSGADGNSEYVAAISVSHDGSELLETTEKIEIRLSFPTPVQFVRDFRDMSSSRRKRNEFESSGSAIDRFTVKMVAPLKTDAAHAVSDFAAWLKGGSGFPSLIRLISSAGTLLHEFQLDEPSHPCGMAPNAHALCGVANVDDLDGPDSPGGLGSSAGSIFTWTTAPSLTINETDYVPLSTKIIFPTASWVTKVVATGGRATANFVVTKKRRLEVERDILDARELEDAVKEREAFYRSLERPLTKQERAEGLIFESHARVEAGILVERLDPILLGPTDRQRDGRNKKQVDKRAPLTLEDYENLFRLIPVPDVAKSFQTDLAFAYWRVAGPNPMLIKGISQSELIGKIGDRISDAEFNTILGTAGDSISAAAADGRLYLVDYESLSVCDQLKSVVQ